MTRQFWTPEERAYLRRNYGRITASDMESLLARHSEKAIRIEARRMGLRSDLFREQPGKRLSPEFYDGVLREYGSATVREIAARRRVNVNTAASWIRRAMER